MAQLYIVLDFMVMFTMFWSTAYVLFFNILYVSQGVVLPYPILPRYRCSNMS